MAKRKNIDTKNLILESAEKLIAKEGVNSFSLRDLASECRISQGTLFYFYKSKNDILYDLTKKHMEILDSEYLPWLDRHINDLTPERFFDVVFYKGIKLFNRAKMHIFIINECLNNPSLTNKYNELINKWRENISIGIKRIYPDIKDVESFSTILLYLIDGLVIQEVLKTKEIDMHRFIEVVKTLGSNL